MRINRRICLNPLHPYKQSVPIDIYSFAKEERISQFASKLIYEEISAAVIMRACISEGRTQSTLEARVSYLYHSKSHSTPSHTVSMSTGLGEGSYEAVCDCLFMNRMKLPCRYALAMAIELDRCSGTEIPANFAGKASKPILTCPMKSSVDSRWMHRAISTSEIDTERRDLGKGSNNSGFDEDVPDIVRSASPNLMSICNRGHRMSYSILLSEYKSLVEECTRSNASLMLGEILRRLSIVIREGLVHSNLHTTHEQTPHSLKAMILSAVSELDVEMDSFSSIRRVTEDKEPLIYDEESNYNGKVKNPPTRFKHKMTLRNKYLRRIEGTDLLRPDYLGKHSLSLLKAYLSCKMKVVRSLLEKRVMGST